ncbi:glycosyltransferase family 2 protein [Streptococcus thermophilus]|nr:glycosyltransferase [Streptococcus thermophilus]
MKELVSIIVPVYNIEKYIEKCITSLRKQSYTNLEIILVNDGSTDNSRNICKYFEAIDDRVTVLDKINGGLSDARNYGIAHSKGEYIVFVDGDDTVELEFVFELHKSITTHKSDISVCSFNLVDESFRKYGEEILNLSEGEADGKKLLLEVLTSYGYKYVVAWNKMYKREIFDVLSFEKNKIYEDEYINYKLFWFFNKVSIVKKPLYNYVQRPGSIISSNMTISKIFMKQEVQKLRIEFYKDKDIVLLNRAKQMYCNWLINCVRDYSKLLSNEDYRMFQNEFRKTVLSIERDKTQSNLLLDFQNCLGFCSLKLASVVKKGFIKR